MKPSERFELGEAIGRDELGEVFQAIERASSKPAAVKTFDAWALARQDARDAYVANLKALRRIQPARTPPVAAYHLDQDEGWIASRWVKGMTLEAHLREQKHVELGPAAAIICGVLDALEELHSTGAPHGGLSMRKVLLIEGSGAGSVVLTDPFQYRLYAVQDPLKTSRNDPDRYLGNPRYFSPEQAQGKAPDVRSDVYVVGLMLYELVTGKPPFDGGSVGTILKRQIYEKPLPTRLKRPGLNIGEDAENIILTALHKDPAKRFQSARAFRGAINNLRVDFEEAAERLAAPLGIAPVGVLAGQEVPAGTESATDAALSDAETAQPETRASVVSSRGPVTGESPVISEDAQRPSVDTGGPSVIVDVSGASDDAEQVPEVGNDAPSNDAPSESSAPPQVSAASASQDAGSERVAARDAVADQQGDEDGADDDDAEESASSRRKRPKKNKKSRKSRANERPSDDAKGAGSVASKVATSATGKSTSAAVTAAELPAPVSDAPAALSTHAKGQGAELPDATTAPPLDVHAEDELGWFASGDDQDVLGEIEIKTLEAADDAARMNRYFFVGITIAGVAAVLLVLAISSMKRSDDGDDEVDSTAESSQAVEGDDPAQDHDPRGDEAEVAVVPTAARGGDDGRTERTDETSPSEPQDDLALATTEFVEAQGIEVETLALDGTPDGTGDEDPTPSLDHEVAITETDEDDSGAEQPTGQGETETTTEVRETTPPEPPREEREPREEPTTVAVAETPPEPVPDAPTPREDDEPEVDTARARDLIRQGSIAFDQGNFDAAGRAFQQAIDADGRQAAAHAGMGDVMFQRRDFRRAAQYFERASRLSRNSSEYHRKLGRSYVRLERYEQAVEAFERAVALGDSDAQRDLDAVRTRLP